MASILFNKEFSMPTIEGPKLVTRNSRGVARKSTVPSFEITRDKSKVFRRKPTDLLYSQTPYWHEYARTSRSLDSWADGSTTATYWTLGSSISAQGEWESANRAATTKLLQKIKGETFNLSTFIGELPETVKWFKDTLKTVVSLYQAVRRGNMRKLRRFVKRYWDDPKAQNAVRAVSKTTRVVSNRWLEWRYAVTPLMMDFENLRQEVYEARNRTATTRHVASETFNVSRKQEGGESDSDVYQTMTGTVRKGCYVSVNPHVDAFKRLGLLNPVATLWELTPLSFVVDWFLPIGDYLSSLDAMVGVSIHSTWSSRKEEGRLIRAPKVWPSWGNSPVYPYPMVIVGYNRRGAQTMEFRNYSRTTPSSLELPRPNIQRSLSSLRLMDAVSLARGLFKG